MSHYSFHRPVRQGYGAEAPLNPWDVQDPATGKIVLLVVGGIATVLFMSALADTPRGRR